VTDRDGKTAEGMPAGMLGTRLLVLEMTVAALAARLPQVDLEEVVAMLVFIAKGTEATHGMKELPVQGPCLTDAGHFATEMLDRIAQSRRSNRIIARN